MQGTAALAYCLRLHQWHGHSPDIFVGNWPSKNNGSLARLHQSRDPHIILSYGVCLASSAYAKMFVKLMMSFVDWNSAIESCCSIIETIFTEVSKNRPTARWHEHGHYLVCSLTITWHSSAEAWHTRLGYMASSLTHGRATGLGSSTFDRGCMSPSTVWRITTERQKGEEARAMRLWKV